MRKVFCVRTLDKNKDLIKYNPLVVAFKNGKELVLKNLTCDPNDKMSASIDQTTGDVILRFKLQDNEYLSLGQE